MSGSTGLQWERLKRGTLELRGKVWSNRYYARAVDPETGEILRCHRRETLGTTTQFRTRAAAAAELDRLLADQTPATLQPGLNTMAVAYFKRFIAVIAKPMRASTKKTYTGIINGPLTNACKGLRLADVDAYVLQQLLADYAATKARKTLALWRTVALRVLRQAGRDGFAVHRIDTKALPLGSDRRMKYERPWIKPHEAKLILATSEHPRRALWAVMYYAGLRAGEALGLRRVDVDRDAKVIRVRQNIVNGKSGGLKTNTSHADLPMLPELEAILTEYLDHHWRPNDSDLLFATSKGTPLRSDFIRDRWLRPMLEQLGIDLPPPPTTAKENRRPRVGLHAFRHGATSMLAALGWDSGNISTFLRHKDHATTERYLHEQGARVSRAVQALHDQSKRTAP